MKMEDTNLQNLGEIVIFNNEDGNVCVQIDVVNDTIWLNQKGMSELFGTTTQNITVHLKNIFSSGELDLNSVCKEFLQTASDGKNYRVKFYNLDAIIAVGYRVNSKRATQFRIWATTILALYASLKNPRSTPVRTSSPSCSSHPTSPVRFTTCFLASTRSALI